MSNPVITFRVVFFNHSRYAAECVQSVLRQTYSPLQVVFSDDCSTDNTYEIIENCVSAYKGPHRVILNRTPANRGLSAHLNSIWHLSDGALEVMGAGDDCFEPLRAEKVFAKWQRLGFPSCSIFSRTWHMSDDGRVFGQTRDDPGRHSESFQKIADKDPSIFGSYPGCAQAITMDQWKIFGPLDERIIQNDVSRQLRSALIGGVAYIPEPLVYYRRTPSSLSRIGKGSYEHYQSRQNAYLQSFEYMITQFKQDARTALSTGYINTDVYEWCCATADQYWLKRRLEIAMLNGTFVERFGSAVRVHGRTAGLVRAVAKACFPRLAHRFRRTQFP